jgi:hypothetical protein
MPKHSLTLIEYKSLELHPLITHNNWFLSNKEVALALNATIAKIVESLDSLNEGNHYSYESVEYEKGKFSSSILFFSKTGIMRLAYHLKSDDALAFVEFIEDINLQEDSQNSAHNFYNEIEALLEDRLKKLKSDPNATLEEINHFIITLDNMIKKRDGVEVVKSGPSSVTDIIETVVSLAQSYTAPKKNS